ncbi:MAG: bacteriohemerythrin [Oscillospiraceae bacterium]|jgi:hemerythrin|nr:bacteriohemerythrin [Oscillospiraceae bacterium]
MAYTWSDDLVTGNALIDSQHKQLIQAVNSLLDACAAGKGRAELNKVMDFLCEYTAKHFADEEKLQIQHKYPDYANHKRLHDGFKRDVSALMAQLKADGPTVVLVGKVNFSVGGWLIKHIKVEDKKVAAHIRAETGKQPGSA